jgi:hypothetical protein
MRFLDISNSGSGKGRVVVVVVGTKVVVVVGTVVVVVVVDVVVVVVVEVVVVVTASVTLTVIIASGSKASATGIMKLMTMTNRTRTIMNLSLAMYIAPPSTARTAKMII